MRHALRVLALCTCRNISQRRTHLTAPDACSSLWASNHSLWPRGGMPPCTCQGSRRLLTVCTRNRASVLLGSLRWHLLVRLGKRKHRNSKSVSDSKENSFQRCYVISALNGTEDNFVWGKHTDFDDSKKWFRRITVVISSLIYCFYFHFHSCTKDKQHNKIPSQSQSSSVNKKLTTKN